ncbi:hypothetical protein D9M72_566560 [compost metagenome]
MGHQRIQTLRECVGGAFELVREQASDFDVIVAINTRRGDQHDATDLPSLGARQLGGQEVDDLLLAR